MRRKSTNRLAWRLRVVRWHRWLGLVAALPLIVVALTGALLAFELEIDAWLNREVARVTPRGERLPYQVALDAAAAFRPNDPPVGLWLPRHDDDAVVIETDDRYRVYVDPYSGQVTGERDLRTALMANVLTLHTSFYANDVGSTVMGCLALIVMLSAFSGLFVWWPRTRALMQALRIAWRAGNARVLYDVHSVVGAYASGLILLIAVTGATFSFRPLVRSAVVALTGSPTAYATKPVVTPGDTRLPLDALLAVATSQAAGAHTTQIWLPQKPEGTVSVYYEHKVRPMSSVNIDPYRGVIVAESSAVASTMTDRVMGLVYPLHTGRFGGPATQMLWCLGALFVMTLPLSGVFMWIRKRRSRARALGDLVVR